MSRKSESKNNRSRKNERSKKNNKSQKKNNKNARQSMDEMKYEIANEFGVNLGPEASSRCNGQVGGEMTKRLVDLARRNNKKNKNK